MSDYDFGSAALNAVSSGAPLLDSTQNAGLVCISHLRPADSRIGAVAQLGERMTGSHEVRGSIPLGSTNTRNKFPHSVRILFILCHRFS